MDGISRTAPMTAKFAGTEVPTSGEVEDGRVQLTFTDGNRHPARPETLDPDRVSLSDDSGHSGRGDALAIC
jgi:hypothetical protein